MGEQDNTLKNLLQQYYRPQEMPVKVRSGNSELKLGIPKEISPHENRIPLRPEAVKVLTSNGLEVTVEAGAGLRSKYSDHDYSEAGATISYSQKEIFECRLVLKILPPTLEEIEYMKPGDTVISALQFGTVRKEYIQALNKKKITSLSYEMIEDRVGSLPLVRAMSEIAGSSVMLVASEFLNSADNGKGIILGGITGVPPASVVILGGGTVAEYAARAALGLGASVKIFDNNSYKLRRLKYNLGNPHLFTSILDTVVLKEAISKADVLIGALRPENGRTPCVVTEEMVMSMPEGSVIIDVSIDHGGCIETSRTTSLDNPYHITHGIIHYGVPNIASRVARTASNAISNVFTPLLIRVCELGSIDEMIFNDNGFSKGVYCFQGEVTNEALAQKFNFRYKNLDLLIAARAGMR